MLASGICFLGIRFVRDLLLRECLLRDLRLSVVVVLGICFVGISSVVSCLGSSSTRNCESKISGSFHLVTVLFSLTRFRSVAVFARVILCVFACITCLS